MELNDLLGLPFADGGRGPDSYDCWGIVREVYRRYGVTLRDYPISAMDAVKIGQQMTRDAPDWAEVHNPLPVPCLVVIQLACGSWANHVGVHIGNNQFIHAYSNRQGATKYEKSISFVFANFSFDFMRY